MIIMRLIFILVLLFVTFSLLEPYVKKFTSYKNKCKRNKELYKITQELLTINNNISLNQVERLNAVLKNIKKYDEFKNKYYK